jgi:hypothetical protein
MFSVWHWTIAIIFLVVFAYAGKVVIRPNSPKQRAMFFQAAGVGAGLIALSYALRILNGEVKPGWSDPGWWIDSLAEAALAGLFIGVVVALFFRRRASA